MLCFSSGSQSRCCVCWLSKRPRQNCERSALHLRQKGRKSSPRPQQYWITKTRSYLTPLNHFGGFCFMILILNILHFCIYNIDFFVCLPFIHLAPGSCTWKFLSKRSSSVSGEPERFPPSSTGKTKQNQGCPHHPDALICSFCTWTAPNWAEMVKKKKIKIPTITTGSKQTGKGRGLWLDPTRQLMGMSSLSLASRAAE